MTTFTEQLSVEFYVKVDPVALIDIKKKKKKKKAVRQR